MTQPSTLPNIVDRLVGYLNPRAGLLRLQARHALAMATPAYEAATPSRTRKFYRDGADRKSVV